jgi:hypothetical protein
MINNTSNEFKSEPELHRHTIIFGEPELGMYRYECKRKERFRTESEVESNQCQEKKAFFRNLQRVAGLEL